MECFTDLFAIKKRKFNEIMSSLRSTFFNGKQNSEFLNGIRWSNNQTNMEYLNFQDQLDKKLVEFGDKIENKVKTWQNQFIVASNLNDGWKEKK